MNRFEEDVAGVLEVAEVKPDDAFRTVGEWSSLKGFGLLVMLENDWDTPMDVERFLTLVTVRDLYREAFRSFAARVLGVAREELAGDVAYGTLPAWDSVAHLRLVMEAEKRFGTYYPLETIPEIRTLDDFLI